jgi:predicted metal-dependent HD superfamily phosphohydrolase
MSLIIEKTKNHVSNLLNEKLTENHLFHNLKHTVDVVEVAEEIANHSDVTKTDLELLLIAAWFHDTGHIETYKDHEDVSCKIAQEFLEKESYPQHKIDQVIKLIQTTKREEEPANQLEAILRDADVSHIGEKKSLKKGRQLREEWRLILGKEYTDKEWYEFDKSFYSNTKFYTPYAIEKYDKRRIKNLNRLENKMHKEDEKSYKDFEKKVKKAIKEKVPERGIETVFRLASRNHIRLSGIADNKANTLISVNAIIISIVLSVLIDKLELSTHLTIPTIIILITCILTIVLAILATKPKVTQGNISKEDIENRQGNLLFFGNFFRMSLDEYEWGMNELMGDREYLYHNLIQDLYFLGLVLEKKYKYLRWAYNVFLYGLIITVISFITAALIA